MPRLLRNNIADQPKRLRPDPIHIREFPFANAMEAKLKLHLYAEIAVSIPRFGTVLSMTPFEVFPRGDLSNSSTTCH